MGTSHARRLKLISKKAASLRAAFYFYLFRREAFRFFVVRFFDFFAFARLRAMNTHPLSSFLF
jgi:hypothetical protein